MNIIDRLSVFSRSHWIWLLYIFSSLCLLSAALFFQVVQEKLPCLICIQVRLLLSLLIIISLIGLVSLNNRALNAISHMSAVLVAIVFIERAYMLLGTERGFVFADCGFELGLPAWFALEEWLPLLYRIETACGYTPEIIFGITMAEALMVISVLFLLVSITALVTSFIRR